MEAMHMKPDSAIHEENCPECGGSGWVKNPLFHGSDHGYPPKEVECTKCDGTGIYQKEVGPPKSPKPTGGQV